MFCLLLRAAIVALLGLPLGAAELNLLSFGADPTGVADSGPALQRALDALNAKTGTALYIPAGRFRLATGASRNFKNNPSSIVIRGEGSASVLQIEVGATRRALQLQNLDSLTLAQLTFVGATTNGSTISALATLSLEYCRMAIVRHCNFYGVTTIRGGAARGTPPGAVVYSHHSDLHIEHSAFHSCAGDYTIGDSPFDGTPVVDNENWTGLTVSDSEFIDWGTLNGVVYRGATSPPSSAWIRVRRPAARADESAAGQSNVVIERTRLDEGAYYAVAIRTGPFERAAQITLSGLMVNGFDGKAPNQGSGLYISGADRVRVERSWFGWTSTAVKPAIDLVNVGSTFLDDVVCDLTKKMTKFRFAGKGILRIRNSVYSALEGKPTKLIVE